MTVDVGYGHSVETESSLPMRVFRWGRETLRPALGWPVFLVIMLLSAMPAFTLNSTSWVDVPGYELGVALAGPLGVLCFWLLLGWRTSRFDRPRRRVGAIGLGVVFVGIGYLVAVQLTAGWLPSPFALAAMYAAGDWLGPFEFMLAEVGRVMRRLWLWRQGILAGGAAQDNLVVAFLFAGLFWLLAGTAVVLARKTRRGLITALPFLWIVLLQLAYGSMNRGAFVYALALAIVLHLILDHERLTATWAARNMDFNPGIGGERLVVAVVVVVGIMTVASVFPNLYVTPIAQAYYDYMVPLNEQIEGGVERVLPDAQGVSSLRRGGVAGGMPNDFLLQGGPTLRQIEVLRYRTNEPFIMELPFEEIGPPAHYMRGGTFATYYGRGWENPDNLERTALAAEEPRYEEFPQLRRELIQSIVIDGPTQILYAAPEMIEASVDFRLETRSSDDMVAAWSRARSYTVVSAQPAISEDELLSMPKLDADTLEDMGLGVHLALPDTVTDRTRNLALDIVDGYSTAYGQAEAIESYLRTFEYDLDVPSPPGRVDDIADYFLFDIQRGYCDYYATAFVVLARSIGLPTRFATGFAGGYWNPADQTHIVTEADAHSWPEVYFPDVGWIPFEPTAAQPLIARVGTSSSSPTTGTGAVLPDSGAELSTRNRVQFSWQVWLWLIPLAGVLWAIGRFVMDRRTNTREPWSDLLAWGNRLGRPIAVHETPLEYGQGLGQYVAENVRSNEDTGRLVAREMQQMGRDISDYRYGPERGKEDAGARAEVRWSRLRGYRRSIRVSADTPARE